MKIYHLSEKMNSKKINIYKTNNLTNLRMNIQLWMTSAIFGACSIIMLSGCANDTTIPVITTNEVKDIAKSTAVRGYTVSSDGASTITVRGVVWSMNENPTRCSYVFTLLA
jgi:hypothetical protein